MGVLEYWSIGVLERANPQNFNVISLSITPPLQWMDVRRKTLFKGSLRVAQCQIFSVWIPHLAAASLLLG